MAPFLNQLSQEDVTVGIYNTEELVLNIPGETFKLPVKVGDPLQEGDIISKAIFENKAQSMNVPKEVFGVPVAANAIPLRDENRNVIGGVGLGTSIEKNQLLADVSRDLTDMFENMSASIEEITSSIDELSGNLNQTTEAFEEMGNKVSKIESFSEQVTSISEKSHILGLNASIEAARAGEYGKGFAVVSKEVQNMGSQTKQFAADIQRTTNELSEKIASLQHMVKNVNEQSTEQAKAMDDMSETVQHVYHEAQKLQEMASNHIHQGKGD
ncbi:methyl-accepting chemotaxis protein [Salibacterium qingdaonense]|uniref:Methyl-accepting chemotaxis protein (MCP) signalling domain-containing protein n=1 Tax=Salibacterium qingdaonense TaxID=266892 RepID=A0A1I4KPI7_9BACI|nr:methyl-accepting chemotaxis protein [Salibacterium qingdaonense]SFL80459.1 Methyl-accepting chemotaxis protein (MCP) signalling domain-containing protein [Salibacterium qingdaonense]